jgi:DnaJ-class molecular chaperone
MPKMTDAEWRDMMRVTASDGCETRKENPMPKETDREFANRILTGMGFDIDLIGDAPSHIAADIHARDREVTEEVRERGQKYMEKHGTGINSITELNEALGFTQTLDQSAEDKVCPRCEGRGWDEKYVELCPDCWGAGKVVE